MREILVQEYKGQDKVWDGFIWQSKNGTIFQTQKFLSYHPKNKFVDRSLIFFKGEKLIAVFPGTEIKENNKRVLYSHSCSAYGGLVIGAGIGIRDAFDIVEGLIQYASMRNFEKIIIRDSPWVYHRLPSEEISFALRHFGFGYRIRELSSAIKLKGDTFGTSSARSAVRKATRQGVTVSITSAYRTYWQILCANLKIRHNILPTHTYKEIMKLIDLFPDKIKLFGAFLGKKLIAGIVVIKCNDTCAYTIYYAQDYKYQDFRPLSLTLYKIVEWARDEGLEYLDLGISTEHDETKINWGLFKFKEKHGGTGVMRDTWELELCDRSYHS